MVERVVVLGSGRGSGVVCNRSVVVLVARLPSGLVTVVLLLEFAPPMVLSDCFLVTTFLPLASVVVSDEPELVMPTPGTVVVVFDYTVLCAMAPPASRTNAAVAAIRVVFMRRLLVLNPPRPP